MRDRWKGRTLPSSQVIDLPLKKAKTNRQETFQRVHFRASVVRCGRASKGDCIMFFRKSPICGVPVHLTRLPFAAHSMWTGTLFLSFSGLRGIRYLLLGVVLGVSSS